MNPNPTLAALGLSAGDRAVILHADDLGMCHTANAAFAHLVAAGLPVCGSAMVPCPWFAELAAYGRAHPEADLGVHLTLNSEYAGYRWGPLSTRDPASGLLDADGYLPRTVEALHAQMSVEAAVAELQAQIDRPLAAGLDVTHLDTHMGAVVHPELLGHYVNLAFETQLPGLFPRLTPALIRRLGLPPEVGEAAARQLAQLEEAGLPLVDHLAAVSLHSPEGRLAQIRQTIHNLPPGLTHFVFHPAAPGPEIEAITPDARARVADYQALMGEELWADLRAAGVQVTGYRVLREIMRAAMGTEPADSSAG